MKRTRIANLKDLRSKFVSKQNIFCLFLHLSVEFLSFVIFILRWPGELISRWYLSSSFSSFFCSFFLMLFVFYILGFSLFYFCFPVLVGRNWTSHIQPPHILKSWCFYVMVRMSKRGTELYPIHSSHQNIRSKWHGKNDFKFLMWSFVGLCEFSFYYLQDYMYVVSGTRPHRKYCWKNNCRFCWFSWTLINFTTDGLFVENISCFRFEISFILLYTFRNELLVHSPMNMYLNRRCVWSNIVSRIELHHHFKGVSGEFSHF